MMKWWFRINKNNWLLPALAVLLAFSFLNNLKQITDIRFEDFDGELMSKPASALEDTIILKASIKSKFDKFQSLSDLCLPSPRRPFIFFHIPKCAGSTLRSAIDIRAKSFNKTTFVPCVDGIPCTTTEGTLTADSSLAERAACTEVFLGHFRAALVGKISDIDNGAPTSCKRSWNPKAPSYDCLTAIREPISRTIVHYYHFLQKKRPDYNDRRLKDLSLKELQDVIDSSGGNLILDYLSSYSNSNDKMGAATAMLSRCVVMVVEDWDMSAQLIEARHPWLRKAVSAVPAKNTASSKHESVQDLTSEQIEVFERLLPLDMQLYREGVEIYKKQLRAILDVDPGNDLSKFSERQSIAERENSDSKMMESLYSDKPVLKSEVVPEEEHHGMQLPPALQKVAQPDRKVVSDLAETFEEKLDNPRQGRGVTDPAKLEFEFLRKKKAIAVKDAQETANRKNQIEVAAVADNGHRNGFVVLGMHRSGTSMLSGLIHTSCGYKIGGPLMEPSSSNEKGYFERIDVALQNDEFMRAQGVSWAANVTKYDWERALKHKEEGNIGFEENGKSSLAFLNNPNNAPWLQKDPRMCITLKTWLKLMNNEPAVVFTYRNPLEVALSLKRREKDFSLERGLRLWIVYNMRAIQNSRGLCVVYSSNDAVLADPMNEVQRISDELTSRCHVPEPPHRSNQEDVDKFVDPSLQHNKIKRQTEEKDKEIIGTYNDGECIVRDYESEEAEGSTARKQETALYSLAMKIFCDLQSGEAYKDNYKWPELQ